MMIQGTKVKVIGYFSKIIRKRHNTVYGTIVELQPSNPLNPIEDHGYITIQMNNGATEDFVYYGWEKHLQIVD